jgi:hypothetical protein
VNFETPQSTEKTDNQSVKKSVLVYEEKKPPIDIYHDPLYNEDGSRNTNIPFCLYVTRKQKEERENNKKAVMVSPPSCKEKILYVRAKQQMKTEMKKNLAERANQLKRMIKARSNKGPPKFPVLPASKQKPRDARGDAACLISCEKPRLRKASQSPPRKLNAKEKKLKEQKEVAEKLKALKKARTKKQLVKYPPVKTKPWKPPTKPSEAAGIQRKPRPVIVIPPFRTRKWVPEPRVKPKEKVVIDYPPVTTK